MNNNVPTSNKVIEKEVYKPEPYKPTEKEIMDALIKQAKLAEDHYNKLVAQFQENLKKILPKVF